MVEIRTEIWEMQTLTFQECSL